MEESVRSLEEELTNELQSREAMEAAHIAMVGKACARSWPDSLVQAQIEMPRLAEVLADEREQRDAMQQR